MHTCEMHAREMQACEVHAHETHAHQMYAYEIYAHHSVAFSLGMKCHLAPRVWELVRQDTYRELAATRTRTRTRSPENCPHGSSSARSHSFSLSIPSVQFTDPSCRTLPTHQGGPTSLKLR
jgi:hypothetical protein